jgi:hypothetical protein
MSIFASDDDAIRFAIRRIYHDVLHREIESQQVQDNWLATWHAQGGDAVLAAIMDSPEGQRSTAAMRKLLQLD